MSSDQNFSCPVNDCAFDGTLSQVIHHVTGSDDETHTWGALGFQHSKEFREAHTDQTTRADRPQEDGASTRSGTIQAENIPLSEVPAIGPTRAEALRKAGYENAADIATVSVDVLSDIPKISYTAACCFSATAKEECGHQDTFIAALSDSLNIDRSDLAETYAELASGHVTPEEAESTLRLLYDSGPARSVVNLTDYSILFRHYLIQARFDQIDDVAHASLDELTEASYVGRNRAEHIRESARDHLDEYFATPETCSRSGDSSDLNGGHPSTTGRAGDGPRNEDDSAGSDPADTATETSAGGDDPLNSDVAGDEVGATAETGEPTAIDEGVMSRDFPAEMIERDQWLLWKQTDDGRKIPRAPWKTGDPLRYVSAMEPENWTSFREATRWQAKLPHDLELAYAITRDDAVVFLDLDDVVFDNESSPAANDLIDEADSYAALSTSGTGIHIFGRGSLSDGVKSLTGPIDEAGDQTLEVYDRNRFIAMTGDHLEGTPAELSSIDPLLTRLEEEFASVSSETPDRASIEPRRSRTELQEIETTGDIQDVFDAINQTRPSDITMRSTQTREHGDGTYSYDPSWVHSESGTRLGVLDDIWVYRKGMIALNALQLVALEEGIITDERDYPGGEDFWEAVDMLRARGAHIPAFDPEETLLDEPGSTDPADEIDRWEIAKRINYGDAVRKHVHEFDRDYQEQLALELAPTLLEAAESLQLSPAVTYRAADFYAKGHTAHIVPGAAHESSLGAALRIATIEAGTPRPLSDIAATLDETPKSIRRKFHRLIKETNISDTISASDLIVDPAAYVPYMARRLGRSDEEALCDRVRELLEETKLDGGSNPMSEVAAAFYVTLLESNGESVTQREIADAADLSKVTIRNNYKKFASGS